MKWKKIFGFGLLALLVPVFLLTRGSGTENYNSENLDIESYFCVYVNEELFECGHNVLTTAGLQLLEDKMAGGSTSAVDYIAIGNGTAPVVSDTTLDSEITDCGFARAQATFENIGIGNWSYAYTFTSTCSIVVNTTGIFNASSSGTIFAGDSFTDVSVEANDQVKITWNATGN